MQRALLLEFNDGKGVECSRCMLSGQNGQNLNGETVISCYGLASRPKCKEQGCRVDCPLLPIEEEQ